MFEWFVLIGCALFLISFAASALWSSRRGSAKVRRLAAPVRDSAAPSTTRVFAVPDLGPLKACEVPYKELGGGVFFVDLGVQPERQGWGTGFEQDLYVLPSGVRFIARPNGRDPAGPWKLQLVQRVRHAMVVRSAEERW